MRKAFSISMRLVLVAALAGCGSHAPRPRLDLLFLAPDDSPTTRLIARGLTEQLAQYEYHADLHVAKGSAGQPGLFKSLLDTGPNVVVMPCLDEEAGRKVADIAYGYTINLILVGVDSPESLRPVIIAPDPAEIAKPLLAEAEKRLPNGGRVLLLYESGLYTDVKLLAAELNHGWLLRPEYVLLRRQVRQGPPPEADLVIACGPDALKAAVEAGSRPFGVDCGQVGLEMLREGKADLLIEPDWYYAGVRAARCAVAFAECRPVDVSHTIPQALVTGQNLTEYLKQRHVLPPPDPRRHPLSEEERQKLYPDEGANGRVDRKGPPG
jgi:predicted small lipoprotein YifL